MGAIPEKACPAILLRRSAHAAIMLRRSAQAAIMLRRSAHVVRALGIPLGLRRCVAPATPPRR
eukprot:gene49675-39663_t